jgi:hypothetical protein
VPRKNSPDHVPVDFNTEGQSELLGDPAAAKAWVAALHLDDGRHQFLGGALRAGRTPADRREQQAILALHQGPMELHDGGQFDDDGCPQQAGGAQPPSAEGGDNTIDRPQVWGPLAGAVQHQQLLLEEYGLGNDRAGTAGHEKSSDGRDQMNQQDEGIAHPGILAI